MAGRGGGEEGQSVGLEHIVRIKVGPVTYMSNEEQRQVTVQVEGGDVEILDDNEIQALTQFFTEFQQKAGGGGEE